MKLEMGVCTLYFQCYLGSLSFIHKDTKERIKGKKKKNKDKGLVIAYLPALTFYESQLWCLALVVRVG